MKSSRNKTTPEPESKKNKSATKNSRPLINEKKKWKQAGFFLAKFFVIYFVLQFLLLEADFSWLENGLAALEGNWVGSAIKGNTVLLEQGVFEINAQCTGLVSGIILAAVVFSLKKPGWLQKTELWLLGAAVLFVLNLGRLFLVLVTAQQFGTGWAEIAHEVSWFSTAVFILAVWLLLSKKIAKVKNVSELVE
jgi:exosortase/archaeosortase family protein